MTYRAELQDHTGHLPDEQRPWQVVKVQDAHGTVEVLCWDLSRARAEQIAQALGYHDRLLEALESMVSQHCTGMSADELDSIAISANGEAMELLDELGRIEITGGAGRRVLARWKREAMP